MKRAISTFWWMALAAVLLCMASPVFAQTQFTIDSTSGYLWGEYTSPYGTNNPGVGSVICDDFKDTTYIGTNYTYKPESFNSFISGVWGTSGSLYQAAAYLVEQIFTSSGLTQQEYNWALWALFDPTDALATMNANGVTQTGCNDIFGSGAYSGGHCNGGNGGLIGTAKTNGPTGNYNNLVVYVPQNQSGSGWCTQAGLCASQEFFGILLPAPEGGASALYLLLSGIACLAAICFKRAQTSRTDVA